MNLSFIEQIVVKYLEAHPEVVERLVESVLTHLVNQLAPPKAS